MNEYLLDVKQDLMTFTDQELNSLYKYFDIKVSDNDALWLLTLKISEDEHRNTAQMPPSCIKQNVARYLMRPGPPFKAGECKGVQMLGNDGKWYQSKANVKGIYTWRKIPAPIEAEPETVASTI